MATVSSQLEARNPFYPWREWVWCGRMVGWQQRLGGGLFSQLTDLFLSFHWVVLNCSISCFVLFRVQHQMWQFDVVNRPYLEHLFMKSLTWNNTEYPHSYCDFGHVPMSTFLSIRQILWIGKRVGLILGLLMWFSSITFGTWIGSESLDKEDGWGLRV